LIQEPIDGVKEAEKDRAIEKAKFTVMELLKQTIRPEFLNRIDETIVFTPLNKRYLKEIVQLQLNQLEAVLKEKDIHIFVTEEAKNHLVESSYDPHFGARPVKRAIQKQVMNELSKAILGDTIDITKTIVMDIFDGKIVFRKPISEKEEVVL
ncbi:MAG: type VI secretion system ATPase TssH, partial [Fluviicola sp.]